LISTVCGAACACLGGLVAVYLTHALRRISRDMHAIAKHTSELLGNEPAASTMPSLEEVQMALSLRPNGTRAFSIRFHYQSCQISALYLYWARPRNLTTLP
jgi:hypothetical protein